MATETRGRRPTYNDYKDFSRRVDAYFDKCAETDEFPDYAGMLIELKIDKETAAAMCEEGNRDYEEFRRIFSNAKLRRESWLARHMVADNKKANGCMNALKQEENGGYSDRKMDSGEKTLRVKIDQIAGGMNAMK